MWRRVLSQSPTEVPRDVASQQQTRQYLDGWKALGALLHGGGSLSGHERNVCFINTHGKRFADASSAIGFDHDSDSRGLAAVDWDGDGDLDIWTANRTAPRAKYLQNNLEQKNNYLQIRLRGTSSNRDAIGAKVELVVGADSKPVVNSLAAGEGLVSQTSKLLHFGLGTADKVKSVRVSWPGGTTETFSGIQHNRRYLLVEGSGVADSISVMSSKPFSEPVDASATHDDPRIVLGRRIPVPEIRYTDLQQERKTVLSDNGLPTLINVWATWCEPCVQELTEWKENEAEFKSRLRVIALNVDGLDQASDPVDATLSKVAAAWKQIGLSFECGTIDPPSFELLEVIERTLLMQQSPLPIPTSFLLDANGELAIVYKGPVSARRLMTDVVAIESSVVDVRDLSASFPGKWYSSPFPPDLLAIPSQLVRLGRAEEAYEYIINNIVPDTSADPWEQLGTTETTLLNVLHNTAQILLLQKKTDEAAVLYRMAIKFVPGSWETHALLSNVLIQSQHSAEALALNRNMARMRPRHPMPQNNIVWILATSDDVQIRDPAKAVELAKQLCNATNMSEPSTLDTLAVAYAANGELEMAIQTGEQAIEAAARLERSDLVNRIQRRVDDLQAELVRQNSADSLDE